MAPIVLLDTYFYTDSIRHKPVQMLSTSNGDRGEDEDQDQLGPCQRFSHDDRYPFIDEFSEFIAGVSTESLKTKLMTPQQCQLAKAVWEAENYGGSEAKCAARLKEIYGPKWYEVTSIKEHMSPLRDYYEYVLILDHQRQWEQSKKLAKLA